MSVEKQEFEYYYVKDYEQLFQYSREDGTYKYATCDLPEHLCKTKLRALFKGRPHYYYKQVEWDKWVEGVKPLRVYPKILASTKNYL